MSGNYNLDVVVKIFAVGIPALLVVLGFFAYIGGFTVEMITGDIGMKSLGIVLMAIGIIIYVIELIAAIYYQFS